MIFHSIGHMITFVPMLWLGYAGMPRRIQDYPWGYAGWHSTASFGHTIVLFGIFTFIIAIVLSIYLKRPTLSKNKGLPFISLRILYIVADKNSASDNLNKNYVTGNIDVLEQIVETSIKEAI
jgi:heme/copper-type cytochrome/quinol oxidase subunit 1